MRFTLKNKADVLHMGAVLLMLYLWSSADHALAKPLSEPFPWPQSTVSLLEKSGLLYDEETRQLLEEDFQDPEVRPALFEGDIAGISPKAYASFTRLGLRWDVFPHRKWINGTVHYHISHKYTPNERKIIQDAIDTLGMMSCLSFVPYDGEAEDYLLIWPVEKPAGCWSFIGRMGGQQVLSLQPPDQSGPKCLGGPGKAIHEILHALGIFHEQSRADRDDYVTLIEEHVIPNFLHNFDKQSVENTTFLHEYDYKSIMHYGTHFFSRSKSKPTLVPKQRSARIGQRDGLSRTDCYKLNILYGCFSKSPYEKSKYETFCDVLGL